MSFETEKRKLSIIDNTSEQNKTENERLLTQTLEPQVEQEFKYPRIIKLIQNYDFAHNIINTPFDSRVKILQQGSTGGGGGVEG